MRLASVGRYSSHFEGLTAVLVQPPINMKYAVFFLLVVVAMAAAAPQYLLPNYYGAGFAGAYTGAPGTLVAGPTVINNPLGIGGRFAYPGYIGGIY